MEKIKFQSEDGIIEFFVEEQTTVAGITYLLVSDSQDDEANAYIMKDVSEEGSEEASYEMVEDDEELVAISKVFEQNYKIDSRHIIFWKSESAVYYYYTVFILKSCNIHSNLLQTTKWNDLQLGAIVIFAWSL